MQTSGGHSDALRDLGRHARRVSRPHPSGRGREPPRPRSREPTLRTDGKRSISAPEQSSWFEENKRHLMGALAEVRRALERHASEEKDLLAPAGPPSDDAHPAGPFALDAITSGFGLSSFERRVL